jgi:hypothetical protein
VAILDSSWGINTKTLCLMITPTIPTIPSHICGFLARIYLKYQ